MLLAVYIQNARSTGFAQRWGGKQKIQFKIIRMIFTDLIVKEMCLRNSGNWTVKLQESAEHS
jgi:hypothetical protein